MIVIQFMFLGTNMFCVLLRAQFNPRLTAAATMSLGRAQNIFMPYLCLISRISHKLHLTCDIVKISLALQEFFGP